MSFNEIDLQKWNRGQMFYYFSNMAPTGYSLTQNIDVTNVYNTVKKNNMKFFPAYLWLCTRNLNKQIEFKVAKKDGVLGYYEKLTPLYASFHEDDKTFSLMWTEYNDNFKEFYESYIYNQKKYGENHGLLCREELPPSNSYTVSALPWIEFTNFCVHSYENKEYYFPSIEAGKFHKDKSEYIMPLSITCHHATTDGYHVSKFINELQYDIDNFEQYIG